MKKKLLLIAGLVAVFGFASFYLLQNYQLLFGNPFSRELKFAYPSFAVTDEQGNRFIIDQSRRRVISSDKDGVIRAVIEGGKKEKGSFFYANEVASDDEGRIYVLNWVLDKSGFFMDREEIVRYLPDGVFDGVVYSRRYDEKERTPSIVQRGQLSALSVKGDTLRWFDIDAGGIRSYVMTLSSGAVEHSLSAELADANLLVANVVRADAETVVYGTKKGKIIEQRRGGVPFVRYSADAQKGALSIPWYVGCDARGDLFFSDLEKRAIFRTSRFGEVVPVLSKEIFEKQGIAAEAATYYRLSVLPDGTLTTYNDTNIVSLSPDGKVLLNAASLPLSSRIIFRGIFVWVLLFAWIACFAALARLFFVTIMNRKIPPVLLKAAGIIVVISVSALLISSLIVQNFSARYQKEALNKIAQMVQIIPKVIDSSRLEQISRQDEFMGSGYKAIRENLLSSLNYNRDEWNNSYYFVLYRVIGDRLYGFMYLNGEIGVYYPVSYFDDPQSVYQRAYKGEIATEKAEDEWGSWLDGVGPIFNKQGKVIGLLEVGTDLYSFNQENSRLIREVILDVVTMLAVFVFAMIEFTFLMDMFRRRERRIACEAAKRALRRDDRHSDVFFARPVTFVMFTALSMSVVFIPVMMGTFYHPVPGLSKAMVLGLPISCEMFFFGVASIWSGRIISRRGWRFVARIGFGVTLAGLLASAFSGGMAVFLVARGITGLGSGFFFMSMRGFINEERDDEIRSEAFSHFYSALIVGLSIGAVTGGFIADKFGYAAVFFAACAVVLVAVAFDIAYLGNTMLMERAGEKKAARTSLRKSAGLFFTDPRVVGFFLLILVPTYVASTFLTYFFPIFAESHGVSSSDVGRLFILNGVFIIYLGPVLSRFFNKHVGARRTMVVGSALWACALAIVALSGNVSGAILALIIMGITEGFCVNAQNEFFLGLKSSKAIGEDQAIGFFEMVGKFAETLGPILFGAALILGQTIGLWAIALSIFWLAVIYVLRTRRATS